MSPTSQANSDGRRSRNKGEPTTAQLRRKGRRSGSAIVLNMAPMIDMTFLLFSFVIVTSTFERPEGVLASEMPEDAGAPAVALPFSPIVVRLTQVGPADDEFAISVDRFADAPQTFTELPEFLRLIQAQPGFDKETPVVIVAEDTVRWDHVVSCWNAALRAGCENIAFAEP